MPYKTNDFKALLPAVHKALHRWYARAGRCDLPWRNTRDAYAIYISEVMLQQTQVKTVLDRYYTPFLARFPTLGALAKSPAQAVTKAWEGLGYYTRAANLHKAARLCKGRLPRDIEGLLALPGIGRNTANAIACFAYGAAVPVMEANVRRVLCRVFALTEAHDETLWEKAALLLNRKNPFEYNQAMMDVGALVCTKRKPRCGDCPLGQICQGKPSPESYPAAKRSKAVPVRERTVVVFGDGKGKYYLAKRKTRFLGGLYGFIEYDAGVASAAFMGKSHPLSKAQLLGAVTQSYSHFTLQAKVYQVTVNVKNTRGFSKVSLEEIKELPLSRADLKIVAMLEQEH